MSMTIEQMRAEVARLYPGALWQQKVGKMDERQILAIYTNRILNKGKNKGVAQK